MQVQEEPGEFSFQVIWTNYPLNSCHTYIQLDSSSPWPIAPSDCFTTFSAPNRVMLVGFNTKQESDEVLLRQSAVFEGRSSDGVYLGNLWDLLVRQIVSNSNELTIYTFGLFEQINYVLYMGVDSKAIQDVQLFRGLNCGDNENTPCLLYLPSNAISAVATVSALGTDTVDYLLPFDKFPYDGTMKIYEGKMTDENLLATVNQTDYKYKFPMAVKNSLKIYYLDKGSVQIPILSYGYSEARYDIVFPGRFINIHSFNYRQLNEDQYTYEGFGTNSSAVKMYFNLNVKYFDASGPTTYLQVEVIQDGYWVFKERYNATYLPPNTLTLYGDTIVVTYQNNGYRTTGFEVDMVCTESTLKTTTPAPTVPNVYTRSAPDSDSTVTAVTSTPTTSTTSRPIPTTTKITAIPQMSHVVMVILIWLTL
ncbi:hypothetical protein CRE_16040 [Caenorhabditis remanei]|uniref:DUF7591 domain-containing protein n=1 Tax=Caenorhabditis remanei TaxID=31234 RepID=E3MBH8_CAERE|nr:hypothetical protein CRE_16040 [Caenorhabditis remanei]